MSPKGIDYYFDDGTPSLAGNDFAVIKASEGASFPPDGAIPQWYAEEQYRIRAGGSVFGAYHFWHPGTDNSTQLANFVKRANLRDGDVIQLDCEVTDGLGWPTVIANKNDMLGRLKNRFPRNRVLLYTYLDFWNHLDGLAGDGLWIADPNSPAGRPRVPSWTIHQYASNTVDYDIANFPDTKSFRTWADFNTPIQNEEDSEMPLIIQCNADPTVNFSGTIDLLSGDMLTNIASIADAEAFKNAGVQVAAVSYATYLNLKAGSDARANTISGTVSLTGSLSGSGTVTAR